MVNDEGTGIHPPHNPEREEFSNRDASPKRLNALLDVDLPVSISFGRSSKRLSDVAQLTSGVLIELDCALADPVELLIDNHVIARGEIVVVEGNYGLVITEIVSPDERLQRSRSFLHN